MILLLFWSQFYHFENYSCTPAETGKKQEVDIDKGASNMAGVSRVSLVQRREMYSKNIWADDGVQDKL